MEQELTFGLDFGRLAVLKKWSGPIMSNFRRWFFHVVRGKTNVTCRFLIKKLHKMNLKEFFSSQKIKKKKDISL